MIQEIYFFVSTIGIILLLATFWEWDKKGEHMNKVLPFIALLFLITAGFGSYDIEKSFISTENRICNTITNITATNTSLCTSATHTYTMAITTYQNSFAMAGLYLFMALIELVFVFIVVSNYLTERK